MGINTTETKSLI